MSLELHDWTHAFVFVYARRTEIHVFEIEILAAILKNMQLSHSICRQGKL